MKSTHLTFGSYFFWGKPSKNLFTSSFYNFLYIHFFFFLSLFFSLICFSYFIFFFIFLLKSNKEKILSFFLSNFHLFCCETKQKINKFVFSKFFLLITSSSSPFLSTNSNHSLNEVIGIFFTEWGLDGFGVGLMLYFRFTPYSLMW